MASKRQSKPPSSTSSALPAGPRSRKRPQKELRQSNTQPPATASPVMDKLPRQTQWLILAVGSGACAAFNGVFAKLTTTKLTTSWAQAAASALGLAPENKVTEFSIRILFFCLNLIFNGIMWGLFTAALTKGTSTTQVSIINTSSNFMITALLGWLIFSEALPPLWWVGALLLVAGNVVIGRREETEAVPKTGAISLGEEDHGLGQDAIGLVDGRGSGAEQEGERLLVDEDDGLGLGDDVDNPI